MSYDQGEATLQEIIGAVPVAGGIDVRRASWQGLSQGRAVIKVVLREGPAESMRGSIGHAAHTRDSNYTTYVELWIRFQGYPESAFALRAAAKAIRDEIDAWPRLKGSAQYSFVSRIDEPQEIATVKDGPPVWLRQILSITWAEEAEITHKE